MQVFYEYLCQTSSVDGHNFSNVIKTAMKIIEDVITNNIEEEQCRKKQVRQETPNYWDST